MMPSEELEGRGEAALAVQEDAPMAEADSAAEARQKRLSVACRAREKDLSENSHSVQKNQRVNILVRLVVAPVVGLIYLGAIGSVVWLDLGYALLISALLPSLVAVYDVKSRVEDVCRDKSVGNGPCAVPPCSSGTNSQGRACGRAERHRGRSLQRMGCVFLQTD